MLARTLPLFLAAAVSPTMFASATVLLTMQRGRTRLLVFTLGWTLAASAFIAFVWFGGHAASGKPSRIDGWIDVGLGVAMLVVGVVSYFASRRPKKPKPKKEHRKQAGLAVFFGAGIVAVGTDFSSLIPLAAAMKDVGRSSMAFPEKFAYAAVGLIFVSLPILLPLVAAFVAPQASKQLLVKLSAWLEKHGALVVAIVFLAVGVYLIVKGAMVLR